MTEHGEEWLQRKSVYGTFFKEHTILWEYVADYSRDLPVGPSLLMGFSPSASKIALRYRALRWTVIFRGGQNYGKPKMRSPLVGLLRCTGKRPHYLQ
jgi:hypothetical protein